MTLYYKPSSKFYGFQVKVITLYDTNFLRLRYGQYVDVAFPIVAAFNNRWHSGALRASLEMFICVM